MLLRVTFKSSCDAAAALPAPVLAAVLDTLDGSRSGGSGNSGAVGRSLGQPSTAVALRVERVDFTPAMGPDGGRSSGDDSAVDVDLGVDTIEDGATSGFGESLSPARRKRNNGESNSRMRGAEWNRPVVFIGWLGERAIESDGFALHPLCAASLGLSEGERVRVSALYSAPVPVDVVPGKALPFAAVVPAARVVLQPIGPDDWEVVELHGAWLEADFVNQVSVVTVGQRLPVWCRGAVAYFVVESITSVGDSMRFAAEERAGVRHGASAPTQHFECATLNNDQCEVVIAPLVRQRQTDALIQDDAVRALQPADGTHAVKLRLLSVLDNLQPSPIEALIRADTARQLGWRTGDMVLIRTNETGNDRSKGALFASLAETRETQQADLLSECTRLRTELSVRTRVVILQLRVTSSAVPASHIAISSAAMFDECGFEPFLWAHVHKIRGGFPEREVRSACLTPLLARSKLPPWLFSTRLDHEYSSASDAAEKRREMVDVRDTALISACNSAMFAAENARKPVYDGCVLNLTLRQVLEDEESPARAVPFVVHFDEYAMLLERTRGNLPEIAGSFKPHQAGLRVFMADDAGQFRAMVEQVTGKDLPQDRCFLPSFIPVRSSRALTVRLLESLPVSKRMSPVVEWDNTVPTIAELVKTKSGEADNTTALSTLQLIWNTTMQRIQTSLSRVHFERRVSAFVPLSSHEENYHDLLSIERALQLRITPPGGVCVYGAAGVGSTTFASAALRYFSDFTEDKTHACEPCAPLIFRCSDGWREARIEVLFDRIRLLFAQAASRAPAVILFDNLDALCPVTSWQAGENSSSQSQVQSLSPAEELRSMEVTEFILQCWEACYFSTQTFLRSSSSAQSSNLAILTGPVLSSVCVLCTCRDAASLNRAFFERGLLADVVQVPTPDSFERANILAFHCRRQFVATLDDLVPVCDDVAADTEGYVAADLALIVRRAHAHASVRLIEEEGEGAFVHRSDFTNALKNFTPLSLMGLNVANTNRMSSTLQKDWSMIVGGLENPKQVLRETIEWPTRYPQLFSQSGVDRLRKGLLLFGPPGCGKTMLAGVLGSQFGVRVRSVRGPEILNKYIGASEAKVRELFDEAARAQPCILFFDEFESIAPRRGHDSTGVTDRVVNQLLTQLDGVDGLADGVWVVAATSRPDLVDPALLRPGRLDKLCYCGFPTEQDREDILRCVALNLGIPVRPAAQSKDEEEIDLPSPDDPFIDVCWMAAQTPGFSGADLQALLYNAKLEAVHEELKVTTADLEQRQRPIGDVKQSIAVVALSDARSLPDMARDPYNARFVRDLEEQSSSNRQTNGDVTANHKPPGVRWRHVESALQSARPSLQERDRSELEAIYRNFLSQRGDFQKDLPNGQRQTLA